MKQLKQLITLLLVVAICLSLLSVSAFAAEPHMPPEDLAVSEQRETGDASNTEEATLTSEDCAADEISGPWEQEHAAQEDTALRIQETSGTCGEALTWHFNEENRTLTISGTGKMNNFYANFDDGGDFETDMPWGDLCRKIKTVIIENGVTNIGSCAFYGCATMTSVTIPNSVMSIGNRAFMNCKNLTGVTIPNPWPEMDAYAFSKTPWWQENAPTSGQCGDAVFWSFDQDSQTLTISGTGEMTSTKYRDTFAPDIKSVVITDGVTSIAKYAFNNCSALTDVSIPNSVTSIGEYAFNGCKKLSSVTIPGSVTSIGFYSFGWCSSLTGLIISDGVTEIGENAFYECSELTCLSIPNSVTSIGAGAFQYCRKLSSISISSSLTSIEECTFSDCTSLTSVTIPDSVTCIGENAFYDCQKLTDLTIPDSVTSIEDEAFLNCRKLIGVTIPKSVTNIGESALGYYVDEDREDDVQIKGFTISGYIGSYAQNYANKNGLAFEILDESFQTSLSRAKALKGKKIKVNWKKNTKGKGYELQYSTNKAFAKSVKTLKIKKNKTNQTILKKLKKATWYIRIRTVNGKEHSSWSNVKKVKVVK